MKTIDISIKIGFCQQEELSELISTLFKDLWRQLVIVILLIAASVLAQRCCLLMVQKLLEPIRRMLLFHQAYVLSAQQSLLLSLSIQTKR